MKKLTCLLAMLLALILGMSTMASLAEAVETAVVEAAPEHTLTLDDLDKLNGGAAKVVTRDGRVTFVEGACTDAPVTNIADAARVVDAMIPLMGGDERTVFEPWRTLTDTKARSYRGSGGT